MKLWKFIHNKLRQNTVVYLLAVIQHKGSSPGRQGFKMVVADDGEIFGSIGGGVMEYHLVETCKALLQQKDYRPLIKHQVHKGTIKDDKSGMICSGEQTVIFYPLSVTQFSIIEEIVNAFATNNNGVLSISPAQFSFSASEIIDTHYTYTHTDESNWSFKENLNTKNFLYIIGGGHVGLATSQVFKLLGFYVTLFDNRNHLNTFDDNTFADKKLLIDYAEVANYITESDTAYVAIMTHKYTDDKLVLSKLLGKNFKYIGVLGSKAKLELLFEVLQKEGFSMTALERVRAPIGLPIHSQTPKEIAISIAAQVIGVKNEK